VSEPQQCARPENVGSPPELDVGAGDPGIAAGDPFVSSSQSVGGVAARAAAAAVRDAERVAAVRATGLLDAPAEPAFDRLTRLAVRMVGVPAAFFSLVDETRDFYASACGFGEPLASERELTGPTFCHFALLSREPLVIPDTAADPIYRDVPTVRSLGVAAYVGVPIVIDGRTIGSFCVIDVVPRAWTAAEIEVLTELAASAEREIRLRATVHSAELLTAQLQRQALELTTQRAELAQQVADTERSNQQLQQQTIELEMQTEELHATAAHLEERTAAAERAATALVENEARLRRLADAMPVQVWTARPDGGLDFVSEQAASYFGVSAERLLGEGWARYVHPDDRPETLTSWTDALASGEPYDVEFRLRAADGTYRWHLARAVPERDALGAVARWIGTNTDVQVPRAALAAAEDAEHRTRAVLESISDAFYALDRAWCFTYVNDRAEQMLARPRAELLGRNLWTEFAPARGTIFEREYRRAMATGEAVAFEAMYAPLDAWFEVRAYPSADGLTVYFQDISDRHAATQERELLLAATDAARREAELQRQQAEVAQRRAERARLEAEAATRAKSEFLATMSHEVRTPINAVLGYADLLALGVSGPLNDRQRQYLDRLVTSGRHLLGLVNEVLDVARVEAGGMTVVHERADLVPVVESALALVRPQAAARGILVDARCGPDSAEFVGDEGRVRQILVNLLANAVKFTDPAPRDGAGGAHRAEIVVSCSLMPADAGPPGLEGATMGPWTVARVTDSGIGIPADQLEAVFEPFMQVERGHTRTRGGSGLGLAISRRLARLMGGDLTVESTPGEGSTFTLWLPVAEDGAATGSPAAGTPLGEDVRDGLAALGRWLALQAEAVTATFTGQLRADAQIPVARALGEADLRDHLSTYLSDVANGLVSTAGSDEPSASLKDGSEIQQLISERHGAQRFRIGFSEAMLAREFELLRQVLADVLRAEAPPAARPALARGLDVLTLFVDVAERIARRAFRHTADTTARPDDG
jgi:PAS domain S-box-containing protein